MCLNLCIRLVKALVVASVISLAKSSNAQLISFAEISHPNLDNINPAVTPNNTKRLYAVFSSQYYSFGSESPETYMAGFSMPSSVLSGRNDNWKNLILDVQLAYKNQGILNQSNAALGANYHIQLSSQHWLSVGFRGYVRNSFYNRQLLRFETPDDPIIGTLGSKFNFDLSSGLYYYILAKPRRGKPVCRPRFYAGFSITNITEASGFGDRPSVDQTCARQYNTIAGFSMPVYDRLAVGLKGFINSTGNNIIRNYSVDAFLFHNFRKSSAFKSAGINAGIGHFTTNYSLELLFSRMKIVYCYSVARTEIASIGGTNHVINIEMRF